MIWPESAALGLSIRPPYRPTALRISASNALVVAAIVLGVIGLVAFVIKLFAWGDRASWAYPASVLMYILSTVTGAPLVAFATRLARGYWTLPARRAVELMAVPSLISFALLIPILATLPPLKGRANLWFDFPGGAPFLTDALAVSLLLLLGMGLLWVSAIPDLAGPPSRVRAMPGWRRALYMNWTGTVRQWRVQHAALRVMGAFFLMQFVFVHMILSTDLGQSLLPGWRSGIFPAYSALSGIHGALAVTIITIWLLRRLSPATGRFIGDEQAAGFGKLLLALTLLWFYFFWSDFLIVWYARLPGEVGAMQTQIADTYLVPFLIAFGGMFLIPFATLIFNPIRRNLSRLTAISVVVLVGLLFDRIRLYVPAMSYEDPFQHRLATLPAPVYPDVVDVLFIVGVIGVAIVSYLWAAARVPMQSGWEMREGAMLRKGQTFMRGHVLVLGKPN